MEECLWEVLRARHGSGENIFHSCSIDWKGAILKCMENELYARKKRKGVLGSRE